MTCRALTKLDIGKCFKRSNTSEGYSEVELAVLASPPQATTYSPATFWELLRNDDGGIIGFMENVLDTQSGPELLWEPVQDNSVIAMIYACKIFYKNKWYTVDEPRI